VTGVITISRLDTARAVRLIGWARTGLGVVAFLVPWPPARPWIGADAARPTAKTLARGLGARDVALGLGTLLAQQQGSPVRGWLAASALADAGDVAATVIGWRSSPRFGRFAVIAAAAAGAVTCSVLAWRSPA